MNRDVFLSILSLDSYNRGYFAGLGIGPNSDTQGNQIGNAIIDQVKGDSAAIAAGFYGISYNVTGWDVFDGVTTVISYRGTDYAPNSGSDVTNGWAIGFGLPNSSQGGMAINFYQDVTQRWVHSNASAPEVILTGHSLGGGLAGLVGSLSGALAVGFDHMPFGAAAIGQAIIDADYLAGDEVEDLEELSDLGIRVPNASSPRGYFVEGEVLQGVREGTTQVTIGAAVGALLGVANHPLLGALVAASGANLGSDTATLEAGVQKTSLQTFGADFDGVGIFEAVVRHSQALLVLLLYANKTWEAENGESWREAAKYVLPELFNDDVAEAIGFSEGTTGAAGASSQMMSSIAYSAIDEGERPFGDVGIKSLLDDTGDLGRFFSQHENWLWLIDNVDELARYAVQFAGKMARGDVEGDEEASGGVLATDVDAKTLAINASEALWKKGASENGNDNIRVGLEQLVAPHLQSIGFVKSEEPLGPDDRPLSNFVLSNFDWSMEEIIAAAYYGENSGGGPVDGSQFDRFVFIAPDEYNVVLADRLDGGSGLSLTVGSGSSETIIGSADNDFIYGDAGDDVLSGGRGDNILSGGAGTDTASYVTSISSGITINPNEKVGDTYTAVVRLSNISTDYLVKMEKVIGTDFADQINLTSFPPLDEIQSIDLAGNSFQPNLGDTVNASEMQAGITVDLRDSEYQLVISGAGVSGGVLHVKNAEAAVGSEHDDVMYAKNEGSQLWAGGGRDILYGDTGNDLLSAGKFSSGGVGIVDQNSSATLIGGDGTDYLANGTLMSGGKGDDVIDARGMLSHSINLATLNFSRGDGQDVVLSKELGDVSTINSGYVWTEANGIKEVNLKDFSIDDARFVWNYTEISHDIGNNQHYVTAIGDLAIVLGSAGDSILFQNVYGEFRYPIGGNPFTNVNDPDVDVLGIPKLIFANGEFFNNGDGIINIPISRGETAAYGKAVEQWTAITSVVTNGTDGDDVMTGSSGNDPLSGGNGDDQFNMSGGHDYFDGGSGNDQLNLDGPRDAYRFAVGRKGLTITSNDVSEGSANLTDIESFSFAGETGVRSLENAVDTDIILGTADADTLIGTSAADQFLTLDGDDDISGGAGDDTIHGGGGTDVARYSGASADYRLGWKDGWVSVQDLRLGSNDGSDLLTDVETFYFAGIPEALHKEDLVASGTVVADSIIGTVRADRIEGGDGDDSLSGNQGSDALVGGAGNDILDGGDGDDIFEYGGNDNGYDSIIGGDGNDRIIAVSDGAIIGIDSWDTVEEISANGYDNVTVKFSGSDDLLDLGEIDINGVDTVDMGDGEDAVSVASNSVSITPGGGGDHVFAIGTGATTICFRKGDGHDILDNPDAAANRNDTLFLTDTLPSDIALTSSGDALIVTIVSTGDSFTVSKQFADADASVQYGLSQIQFADGSSWGRSQLVPNNIPANTGGGQTSGSNNPDLIVGGGGDDTIDPLAGNDRIVAGLGDDVIQESLGNDTYVWNPNEGDDLVSGGGSWDGINTIEFGPGVAAQDLRYAYADGQGYGLKVSVTGQTGSITIDYQFLGGAEERIDQFRFSDGTVLSRRDFQNAALTQLATAGNDTLWGSQAGDIISGGTGNDTLDARGGNDTIIGGAGNDLLLETNGDDTYVWNLGDGDDYISGGSGDDGYNTIQFGPGITAADLRYSYVSSVGAGYGLKIAVVGQPGSVTIDYQMISPLNERVDRIRFADGSVLTREQFVNAAIAQASTSGDDNIWGSLANETISGGNGDDRIDPRGGNDIVIGGNGDDTLIESDGDDVYVWNLGDDDDYISGGFSSDGYNVIKFGPGIAAEDLRYDYENTTGAGYGLKIRVAGHSGSITIDYEMVSPLNERIDELRFDDGTSLTRAQFIAAAIDQATTTDADTVWGSLLDDTIFASLGADQIDARQGNDYIAAQGGNDTIVEGAGDDTYVWHLGDDSDYIIGGSASDGFNTIQFGPGITAADLRYGYDNRINDGFGLKIWVAGHDGSVTIDQQMNGPLNERIDQIRFDDGSILTREQFMNAAVAQAASNGSDEIWGSQLNETIYGLNEDDYIDPRGGNDRVIGGSGDDTIKESDGDDTYVWNFEDDDDVITGGGSSDGFNTIEFGPGITAADLQYNYSGGQGNGLKISIPGDDGSIILEYQLAGGATEHIDQLKFADGSILTREEFQNAAFAQLGTGSGNDLWGSAASDVINGGGGSDTIDARAGDDVVTGGAGNDTLVDGLGADIYIWNLGDGNDTITESTLSAGTDVIQFGVGITAADIESAWVSDGEALRISVNGQPGSITLKTQIEELHFSDSSTLGFADLLAMAGPNPSALTQINGTNASETLVGTAASERFNGKQGNDTLIGGSGSDVYVYASGDGNDSIFDENMTIGVDKLRLIDLNADDVTLRRDIYHLYVKDNSTGQEIQVQYQYHAPYDQGIEQIEFADGTLWDKGRIEQEAWFRGTAAGETILGTSGNEVISGGGGNDYIEGRAGSDTYIYASGDGADDIFDETSTGAADTLKLVDLNPANVTLRRDNYHLYIRDNATGDETRVQYQFYGHGIEQLQFADGTMWDRNKLELEAWFRGGNGNDSLYGTSANETFKGGAGNDYIEGRAGSDTYVYASGDGADDIWDEVSTGSVDMFKLTDLNAADVTFRRDNYHLYVKDNATGAETRIQYQFIGHGVELVKFADGTEWDRARIEAEAAYRGSSSAESIFGTAGSETFYGNGGNDYIEGRAGSDTYVYASGDGADDIFDEVSAGTVDVLKLVDLDPADVTLRRDTYHLYVKDNATNQETRVQYQFIGHGIEQLQFADGTIWSRSDIDVVVNGGMVLNGSSGNDTLNGGVGNDLARGKGGNDIIDLGQGTDVAEFSGLQADYSLVTSGGTVTITDDQATTDGDDGTDTLIGVETARFKDGSTLNLAAPIVLDLDGNGVSLVDRNRSKTSFDWDGDGQAERTGWAGKKDGLLTYDRNGDGKVSGANELSFIDDKPGAVSDLDGLSAFDSNGDGIFSARDEKFSEFRVWRDANGNGRSDRGELKTLDAVGIASISLDRNVVDKEWGWGENITLATGTFTRKNGRTGAVGDVALNYAEARGAQAASLAANQLVEALAAFRNDNGGDQIDWLHDQLENRHPVFAAAHALR